MEGGSSAIAKTADDSKGKFSSEYMSLQIELMVSMQSTNPTNAIGLAKELIESCCKTILDELGIEWSKNDDVPQLTNKALGALNLLPANIKYWKNVMLNWQLEAVLHLLILFGETYENKKKTGTKVI